MANPEGKGGFQPGRSGNPAGRPASAYQSFKDRLAHWIETKNVGEIERLIKDKRRWQKLAAIDAMVAMRVSEAYERGGGASMTIILDRLLGKAPQAITVDDTRAPMPVHDINEIARRTAFLFSMAMANPQQADAPVIEHQPAEEQKLDVVVTSAHKM